MPKCGLSAVSRWCRPVSVHFPKKSLAQQFRKHRVSNLLVGNVITSVVDGPFENRNAFLPDIGEVSELGLQFLKFLTMRR